MTYCQGPNTVYVQNLRANSFSGFQDRRDRLLRERSDASDAGSALRPPRPHRRRRRARLPVGQAEGATVQVGNLDVFQIIKVGILVHR